MPFIIKYATEELIVNYSIQLFSVRDTTPSDMEGTLRRLSETGYKAVEFAGFFGYAPAQIRAWLDQYGLTASGTHTGWEEIRDRFDEVVEAHRMIGCTDVIIPSADFSTEEKLAGFVDFVNEYQPKLAKEGLRLGYHNHDFEFRPTAYGKIVHEELQARTSIDFEIDTYWAYHAGVDPVALMRKLADRVHVIHIKDGLADGSGKPLGMGSAPVDKVYAQALKMGALMVVESETLTPDGLTEAKICFDYLQNLERSFS